MGIKPNINIHYLVNNLKLTNVSKSQKSNFFSLFKEKH